MLKVADIKRLIDNDINSKRKRLAMVGQRYYESDHDIKGYKMYYYNDDGELCEDKARSNERIAHPFFTELADQLEAFILSNESGENIIRSDVEGLQEHLDRYFDEEFWSEIGDVIKFGYVKGFEYVYAYKNAEDRIAYQCADSMGVVEVREQDTDDACKCFIWWYVDRIGKNNTEIIKIQVHTDKAIYFYEQEGKSGKIVLDKDIKENPRPNVIYTDKETGEKSGLPLGFIPFFRLDYTKKQFSGLKPIKAIIDDYDLMNCGLSNNLQDFDHPIYVVKGYDGQSLDELQMNVKTKKIVGTDPEGGLDVMTVNIPYEARKAKMDEDKRNIYHFGGGVNTEGLKDSGATTNLAIYNQYAGLRMKAKNYIKRIKPFLKELAKPVIDEINTVNGTAYKVDDIYFNFTDGTPVNSQETAQNEKTKAETQQIQINNLMTAAAYLGDDEILEAICEIYERDPNEIKRKLEKDDNSLNKAQNALDGVVPNEGEEEPGAAQNEPIAE